MLPAPSPGQLQTLGGIQIYFEVHGTGEPLILLHGFSGAGHGPVFGEAWPQFQKTATAFLQG